MELPDKKRIVAEFTVYKAHLNKNWIASAPHSVINRKLKDSTFCRNENIYIGIKICWERDPAALALSKLVHDQLLQQQLRPKLGEPFYRTRHDLIFESMMQYPLFFMNRHKEQQLLIVEGNDCTLYNLRR